METRPGRECVECLRSEDKILHGDNSVGLGVFTSGGLDGFDRPPRRLFSRPDTPSFKEVPEVRLRGTGLSVPFPLLRSVDSPASFHKDPVVSSQTSSPGRNSSFHVPRRLAAQSCFEGELFGGPIKDSSINEVSRPHYQREEVLPYSQSADCLFGSESGLSDFSGFSVQPTDSLMPAEDRRLSAEEDLFRERMDEPRGNLNFSGEVCKTGALKPETTAVLPAREVAQETVPGLLHIRHFGKDKGVPPLVEVRRKAVTRTSSSASEPRPNSFFRRLGQGLGSDYGDKRSFGPVAKRREKLAYQSKGTKSGSLSPVSLSKRSGRQMRLGPGGQHDRSGIHSETGGHSLVVPLRDLEGASSLDGGDRDQTSNEIHSRGEKCSSGPSQQKEPGPIQRVDFTSPSLRGALEDMGTSAHRSLCNRQNDSAAPLLLSSSRQQSGFRGCNVHGLVGPGPVCLSPVQDPAASNLEVLKPSKRKDDSGGSILAVQGVVPGPSKPTVRLSETSARETRFTQTAALSEVPPKLVRSSSCRLQTVRRLIRKRGFSREASEAIAKPRRESSDNVYQAKWTQFRSWCRREGVSSSSTSIAQMADFLLFLHREKKLAVPTIKGYRAMLASVFRHRGLEVSLSQDLSDLIRSFNTSKRDQKRPVAWNLDVVLRWLRSQSFEPMANISLKDLTKKTLFLVALATARRVSELHAIDKRVGFAKGKAVCMSTLGFLAKNEDPSRPWPREFEIKDLSQLVGPEEPERYLCPVRALKFYVQRTKKLRGPNDHLWCSVRDPSRPLSKNALSFFLRSLIKEAHEQCADSEMSILKVKAHEIRAVSTSVAFSRNLSVKDLVKSTFWRCKSVFASHYLVDVQTVFEECSTLGPFIATDTVLGEGEKESAP